MPMAAYEQGRASGSCWDEVDTGGSEARLEDSAETTGPRGDGRRGVNGDRFDERMTSLVRTIEGEIIPRLVLARRADARAARNAAFRPVEPWVPDAENVTEFAELLLAHEASIALAYVESIRVMGASLESICLDLLAPAARRLGEMWSEDRCNFMDVTLGLCRLHDVLREVNPGFRDTSERHSQKRKALLVPAPGEQHTFGLAVVIEFFRRAGWEVWSDFPQSCSDLVSLVQRETFAVVGLSVGSDVRLERVAGAIHAVRRASRNQQIGVLVGGSVINARPELVALVGADATASDGRLAALQADNVVGLLARPC
jgi:MerR family transcriptional regulator, light-induced transcriptional regulator